MGKLSKSYNLKVYSIVPFTIWYALDGRVQHFGEGDEI
jgi:hypothetical protein